MDKILFSLLILVLISFIPLQLYFGWQRVKNNEIIYVNNKAYICKDNQLYTERVMMSGKITHIVHNRVENDIDVPVICVGDKIYEIKGE